MALMALSFSASVICILFVFANVIKKSGKTIFHGNYGRSALFDGGGDGEKGDRGEARAGGCRGEDCFVHRCACGDDVVDDGGVEAVELLGVSEGETAAYVLGAAAVGEACLRAVVAYGDEVVGYGGSDGVGYATGDFFTLVVAAPQSLADVHRHGEEHVDVGGVEAAWFRREGEEVFAEEESELPGHTRTVVVFGVADESGVCVIGIVTEPCPSHACGEGRIDDGGPVDEELVSALAAEGHGDGALRAHDGAGN